MVKFIDYLGFCVSEQTNIAKFVDFCAQVTKFVALVRCQIPQLEFATVLVKFAVIL